MLAGGVAGGEATATGARSADLGESSAPPSSSSPCDSPLNPQPFFLVPPQVLSLLQPQLLQGPESQPQQPLQLSL